MKRIALVAAGLALVISGSAFAAEGKHDHSHGHKPLHGGVVVEVKDVDYELVAAPALIRLHLRDHGKAVDVSRTTAKLTLLMGNERQEVDLKPAGGWLEAAGTFKVAPGTRVVAVVTTAGKPAATVRFVMK
ncbi:MAG: hypothetical protein K2W80_08250 [Burkholderiales bacterium]|jgi:hypothetical protein|nr:hypothetical protein [Burkholderiales bacterium]